MIAAAPEPIALTIRLDDSPRYKGSVHNDEVARRMGYRAALIPGAFLYGHFSRVALDLWGRRWIEAGSMGASFRRPVYNGDAVEITITPEPGTGRFALALVGADGHTAAEGWIAPAADIPLPRLDAWPLRAVSDTRPAIAVGAALIGLTGTTPGSLLTDDEIRQSRSDFAETHPLYQNEGLAHPGFLMRRAMFEVNASFRWPGPVVLTACEAQHFALVRPGMRIETSSVIAEVFERRGKHYVVTDELMLADGRPSARYRRTQLYAQGAG